MAITEGKPHRILLLNPPGDQPYLRDYYCSHVSKAHYYWHPYDLVAQSGVLGDHAEIDALDALVLKMSPEQARKEIVGRAFDTLLVLSGTVSWKQDFDFVKGILKEHPCRVVGTGDILISEPRRVMEHFPFIEAILLDFTSPAVAEYLAMRDGAGTRKPREPIPYLVYMEDGTLIHGGRPRVNGTFSMPLPRYEIFPYRKYRIPHGRGGPFLSTLTDFGCPFKCTFCIGGTLGYKRRDIHNVMRELQYGWDLGLREMWVKDCTFGCHRRHHTEFLHTLLESRMAYKWACLSRTDVQDEEMLSLMARTGCHTIQFGVENADESILERVKKGTSTEKTFEVFRLCRRLGIRTLAHFMIGLPGETEKSFRATLQLAIDLDPDFLSINVAMPRMGTEFRKEALEAGIATEDMDVFDNSRQRPILRIGTLDAERVWQMRNQAIRRFHLRPRYIWRTLKNTRSPTEFFNTVREAISLLGTVKD